MIPVKRLPQRLRRDAGLTIARFFWPGSPQRAAAVIARREKGDYAFYRGKTALGVSRQRGERAQQRAPQPAPAAEFDYFHKARENICFATSNSNNAMIVCHFLQRIAVMTFACCQNN